MLSSSPGNCFDQPNNEPTMNASSNNALLTRQEAAALLRIKPQTLAVWSSTGRYNLPYCKVGRSVRYRKSDLDLFLKESVQ